METEDRYLVGTTVMLKAGGPIMTVLAFYSNEDTHLCGWFDKDKKYQTQRFPLASLKRAEDVQAAMREVFGYYSFLF